MQEKIRTFLWKRPIETSEPDLVRYCGEKLTDRELWRQFQERFQGLIFLYVMRALHIHHIHEDVNDIVSDLTQEVYVRLVQNDGRTLRSYRGTTEFSVRAFLAAISISVVKDYQKRMWSDKRTAQVIPIDHARTAELKRKRSADAPELDSKLLGSMLSYIDMERVIEGEADHKHARRNALVFQLHYIHGFDAGEIAKFPGFELSESGVHGILGRLRKRLQQ